MYVGWRKNDGTYNRSGSWLTSNFTVQEEGDYVFNFNEFGTIPANEWVSYIETNFVISVNFSLINF